jgi:hypothetical protein
MVKDIADTLDRNDSGCGLSAAPSPSRSEADREATATYIKSLPAAGGSATGK